MATEFYNRKVIISGNVSEVYNYEQLQCCGYETERVGRAGKADPLNKLINRDKVMSRAKTNVRRLINANIEEYSKFLTLTFKENIKDLKAANYEFNKFIKRLNYNLDKKIEYLVVVEFQDGKEYIDKKTGKKKKGLGRGAIHYHVMLFNMPFVHWSKLVPLWKNGSVKINAIDKKTCDNVGAYVSKYMRKNIVQKEGDDRLVGEKMWFRSRGLNEPFEIKEIEGYNANYAPEGNLIYESSFENEHIGKVDYQQYNTESVKKIESTRKPRPTLGDITVRRDEQWTTL